MLGGSFWVSMLRNGIGAWLMLSVFLMLDRPRLSMKKTVLCYVLFGLLLVVAFSAWYVADQDSFVRFAGLLAFPLIGILGVVSGIVLAEIISKVSEMPVAISVPAAIGSVIFSMLIGIVFGMLPSYKAANLNPIEALRRE